MAFDKIYMGFLFFFDLRINGFDILPDFVGYIIIFQGLCILSQRSRSFNIAKIFAMIMIFLSPLNLYQDTISIGQGNFEMNYGIVLMMLVSAVLLSLKLTTVYWICKGIEYDAHEAGIDLLKQDVKWRWKLFLIASLSGLAAFMIALISPIMGIVALALSFIFYLVVFLQLRNVIKRASDQLKHLYDSENIMLIKKDYKLLKICSVIAVITFGIYYVTLGPDVSSTDFTAKANIKKLVGDGGYLEYNANLEFKSKSMNNIRVYFVSKDRKWGQDFSKSLDEGSYIPSMKQDNSGFEKVALNEYRKLKLSDGNYNNLDGYFFTNSPTSSLSIFDTQNTPVGHNLDDYERQRKSGRFKFNFDFFDIDNRPLDSNHPIYLVCVYYESKFGKEISWAKVIPAKMVE